MFITQHLQDPSDEDFGHDLTWDGKKCYYTPVVTVIQIAFLWYFNDDSMVPVICNGGSFPDVVENWL